MNWAAWCPKAVEHSWTVWSMGVGQHCKLKAPDCPGKGEGVVGAGTVCHFFLLHPVPPLGTFCASALSAMPTPTSRRRCGKLPLREWDVAFTMARRLFLSQVALLTGDLTPEWGWGKGILKAGWSLRPRQRVQLTDDRAGIGSGRWDHYVAVPERVPVGRTPLARGHAKGGLEEGPVPELSCFSTADRGRQPIQHHGQDPGCELRGAVLLVMQMKSASGGPAPLIGSLSRPIFQQGDLGPENCLRCLRSHSHSGTVGGRTGLRPPVVSFHP